MEFAAGMWWQPFSAVTYIVDDVKERVIALIEKHWPEQCHICGATINTQHDKFCSANNLIKPVTAEKLKKVCCDHKYIGNDINWKAMAAELNKRSE